MRVKREKTERKDEHNTKSDVTRVPLGVYRRYCEKNSNLWTKRTNAMSSALLSIFLRSSNHLSRQQLASRVLSSSSCFNPSSCRQFSSTSPTYARKLKERPPPSKAKIAAKERRKALKARKNFYESEKMPLVEAVKVLRVSCCSFLVERGRC